MPSLCHSFPALLFLMAWAPRAPHPDSQLGCCSPYRAREEVRYPKGLWRGSIPSHPAASLRFTDGCSHLYSTRGFLHRHLGVLQRDTTTRNAGPARRSGSPLAQGPVHLNPKPAGEAEALCPSVIILEIWEPPWPSPCSFLFAPSSDPVCLALSPTSLPYWICGLLPLCASM